MCHQVRCERCGRPTWSGCGRHIEQALGDVALQDRCTCSPDDATSSRETSALDAMDVSSARHP